MVRRAAKGALDELPALVARMPGLRLLVLHGSRARHDAEQASDWDFAFLADPGFDELALRDALARALRTDAVDVVDLDRAGGLVRVRVARDGRSIFEARPSEFDDFCFEAVRFWLEVADVVRPEYARVLGDLG